MIEKSTDLTVTIGRNVTLNSNVELHYVVIDDNVKIGKNTTIFGSKENPVHICEGSYISPNCYFNGSYGLKIGKFVTVSYGVYISTDSGPNVGPLQKAYPMEHSEIIIGSGCWIGAMSILLPGSNMSKESILGSNSLLKAKIETRQIFAGNPAQFIKEVKER